MTVAGTGQDYWRHRRTRAHDSFRSARDLLLAHRDDHVLARRLFRWPRLARFNWALEWFDVVADGNQRSALALLDGRGGAREISFAELSSRSDAVAVWLERLGVRRGDRMMIALGQRAELWECVLACMKIGVVVIPAYTSLTAEEAIDRVARGGVTHVVCEAALGALFDPVPGLRTRIVVNGPRRPGWRDYRDSLGIRDRFYPRRATPGDEVAFCYFTSGTTSRPKVVAHTHTSYPVGHLSSMYWNGLVPHDRHLNVSAPGWAKHSWSSLFVPWNAEATVVALPEGPTPVAELPELLAHHHVDSFCAPPSVWRPLAAHAHTARPTLREATSAGEPLDRAAGDLIARAWHIVVRDGYGQTETTGLIGTSTGMTPRPGWLGAPLPGYTISLRDPETGLPGRSGEVCVELCDAPVGITAAARGRGYYRTGDLGESDGHGRIRVLGRRDDVFKSFDHRVSPYELEAVLQGHLAVSEVAVIPRPHPVGGATPHAVVVPVSGLPGDRELAGSLLRHVAAHFPTETRARSVEFVDRLPRTSSGKVRRSALTVGSPCFDTKGASDAEHPGIAESADSA
jgi:acetyl-CoA synthetase